MSQANDNKAAVLTKKLMARDFVDDQADLLTSQQEDVLFERLSSAHKAYGPYLMVVTVKSLKDQPIEKYSINLARRLAIGDAKRDDGLLLLIAPNERKLRIEVGYGLEGLFPDEFCKKIIDQVIVPQFKQNNWSAGISAGAEQMIAKMKDVPTNTANENADNKRAKDAA